MAETRSRSMESMDKLINSGQVNKVLEKQKDKIEREKTQQLIYQTAKGAIISGAFASAGYLIRLYGEEHGWWGGHHANTHNAREVIKPTKNISPEEAKVLTQRMTQLETQGHSAEADAIRESLKHSQIKGSDENALDYVKKSPKTNTSSEPKNIPDTGVKTEHQVTPSVPAPETTSKSFEDIIDSSRVGNGSDSVWRSTKEVFLYHNRDLNYDGPKDALGNPTDGAHLDAWAEKRTAEMVDEWSKSHGGHIPDVVHDGDKVVIEFDAQHNPHLKVYEAKYNGFEEMTETKPAAPVEPKEHPIEPQKDVDEQELLRKTTEDQLKEIKDSIAPSPLPITPEIHETMPPALEKLKDVYEHPGNSQAEKINSLKTYIAETLPQVRNIPDGDLATLGMSPEEINTFANMFVDGNLKGIVSKIEDIDTPLELGKALGKFEQTLRGYTYNLLDGKINLKPSDAPVPILGRADGHVYFAQPRRGNNWEILKYNNVTEYYEKVKNGTASFWNRNKFEFQLKDIKKLLDYK